MRRKAFRAWAIGQQQELADPNNDIDVTMFNNNACSKMQTRLAQKTKTDCETLTRPSTTGTLGTFTGRIEDWPAAKHSFQAHLGQMKNKNGIPYFYVTQDEADRPANIDDDVQDSIWNTPTQGRGL
jgi:hypothetical protein